MIIDKSVVRISFGFIFSLAFSVNIFAQKWEIGAGAGVCQYKGDIMPNYKIFVVRPGGSVFARMNVSRSISLKAQGMYGGVTGNDKFMRSDPYHQGRAYSFNATIAEVSGQIEYNFLNFRTTNARTVKNWTPYVFGGYGGATVNTKAQRKSTNNPVFTTKSSPNFISLGIGIKKQWKSQWNWGVEFGTRWISDDFLESVGYYPDGTYKNTNSSTLPTLTFPYTFEKNQVPGTSAKDMYYYTNFSISYLFYKVHCPNPR